MGEWRSPYGYHIRFTKMRIDNKQIQEQIIYAEKILKRLDDTASLSRVNELRQSADDGNTQAMVELGKIYLYADKPIKNVKKAYELFANASKKSNVDGQAYAAYCIYLGIGTKQDEKIAMKILASLCRSESAAAYELLGNIYMQEGEYVKASSCFKREYALSKSEKALYFYATCLYHQGLYEDALKFYKKANGINSKFGGYELAICTLEGKGTNKDIDKAIKLFDEAIDCGDHVEMCNIQLAKLYIEGIEVKENLDLADEYIQNASEFGDNKDEVMNLMRESLRKRNEKAGKERKKGYIVGGIIAVTFFFSLIVVIMFNTRDSKSKQDAVQTTEVQQKKNSTVEKEFLAQIYNTYRVEDERIAENYASALGNISEGRSPLGVIGEFDPKFNRYAVYDVDSDGKEELILVYDDPDTLYMSEYICGFDENNSRLYVKFRGVPYLNLYPNGIAIYDTANADSDHEVSYEIYKIDDDGKDYSFYGYVENWNSTVSQTDKSGNQFPTDVDKDGDGIIYVIYDKDYVAKYVDGTEYEQFKTDLYNADEMVNIIYSDIE